MILHDDHSGLATLIFVVLCALVGCALAAVGGLVGRALEK